MSALEHEQARKLVKRLRLARLGHYAGNVQLCRDAADALEAALSQEAEAEGRVRLLWKVNRIRHRMTRDLLDREERLREALEDLHAEVEMAESVGVCLPNREPSLRAGQLLSERAE